MSDSSAPPTFHKTVWAETPLSRDVVWAATYDKIRHPDKWIGAKDVKILKEGPDFVDREMKAGPPGAEELMKERITWDDKEGVVTFHLVDHPERSGSVKNVVSESGGKVRLSFIFDWNWRPEADRHKAEETIARFNAMGDKFVVDMVRKIEEEHRQ